MGELEILAVPTEPKARSWWQQFFRFTVTIAYGGGLGFLMHSSKIEKWNFTALAALLIVAFFGLESYAERIFDKWSDHKQAHS